MKRLGFITSAIVAAAVLALSFAPSANAAGDKAKITDIEHKIIDATTADQVMKYYDKDDIDLYDFHPPLQYAGSSAVSADLADFFNNATDVKGVFVDLVVETDGKMGMARSLQHFTWKGKDGKPGEGTFRVTDVYKKVGGQWKVIHSHVSVPVDPSNGQAAMNLKS
ncbi:MAG: YybH family protein [Candidatus Binataceae bacterium]